MILTLQMADEKSSFLYIYQHEVLLLFKFANILKIIYLKFKI